MCVLVDGFKIIVFVVEVFIDIVNLSWCYEVLCMENLVYDLIIGNVLDVRFLDKLNYNW